MVTDPAHPQDADGHDAPHTEGSTAPTPRWVKVFGLVALGLVLLFVVLQVVAGGDHGPGRHGGGDDGPRPAVTEEGGHRPPPDGDHAPPP